MHEEQTLLLLYLKRRSKNGGSTDRHLRFGRDLRGDERLGELKTNIGRKIWRALKGSK